MKFRCPNCQQRLHVASDWVGKKVACPACRSHIHVPAAPTSQPLNCPTCGNELVPGDKICKKCRSYVDGRRRLLTNMREPGPSAQTTEIVAPRDLLDDSSSVRRAKTPSTHSVKSAEEFLSSAPDEEGKESVGAGAPAAPQEAAPGEEPGEGHPLPAAEITSAASVVGIGSRKHLWFVLGGALVLIIAVLVVALKGCV